jgi:hypothetical protein
MIYNFVIEKESNDTLKVKVYKRKIKCKYDSIKTDIKGFFDYILCNYENINTIKLNTKNILNYVEYFEKECDIEDIRLEIYD